MDAIVAARVPLVTLLRTHANGLVFDTAEAVFLVSFLIQSLNLLECFLTCKAKSLLSAPYKRRVDSSNS